MTTQEGTMRNFTLRGAGLALCLGLAALAVPGAATAQKQQAALGRCITCTAENVNGSWKCTMSVANTGWTRCECNPLCNCSGDCITPTDTVVTPIGPGVVGSTLTAVERLPAAGGILRSAPSDALLASLDRAEYVGRVVNDMYLGENYGLVRQPGGSWRIFRLQDRDTMALHDCDGLFRGLVHRAGSADERTAPLAVASL